MSTSPSITHQSLLPFALSSNGPVRSLVASAVKEGEHAVRFRYELDADLSALRIPAPSAARQRDELWKHTCFEAFIQHPARSGGYTELNFSPSTEWAAYSFESYRKGMAPLALAAAPRIEVMTAGSQQLVVEARVSKQDLLGNGEPPPSKGTLNISLTAVIEDASGRISYWALKHAPDKPDFHHPAGFILEV